jgi:hypothetical protein
LIKIKGSCTEQLPEKNILSFVSRQPENQSVRTFPKSPSLRVRCPSNQNHEDGDTGEDNEAGEAEATVDYSECKYQEAAYNYTLREAFAGFCQIFARFLDFSLCIGNHFILTYHEKKLSQH